MEVAGFGGDCFRSYLLSSVNDKSMGSLTEPGVAENMKVGGSESALLRLWKFEETLNDIDKSLSVD